MGKIRKILILLVCLTLFQGGNCRTCYVCSSYNANDTCTDPFNQDDHVGMADTCDNPRHVCVKEKVHSAGFKDTIHRGCFPDSYCENFGKKSIFCGICEKNFCNSSSFVTPSFTFIGMVLLFRRYVL